MLSLSLNEFIKNYIPNDATPVFGGIIYIPKEQYSKINKFGELTIGKSNEISVFRAMKILANENRVVKEILTNSSTKIGLEINETILNAIEDPWFESVLLYRPDMLIANNGNVYTNELEIVCGGISFPSLLQKYLYNDYKLLNLLFTNMNNYKTRFNLKGCLAIIGDKHAIRQLNFTKWIEKEYKDVLIIHLDELNFKKDGVYFEGNRIAVAQLFIKAHKMITMSDDKASITLLRYWINKKIYVFSPPSLLMDNKSIMYILQANDYGKRLRQLLGVERYNEIHKYLPKTYLYSNNLEINHFEMKFCNCLIKTPWKYGQFIFKYATTWGSNNILIAPKSPEENPLWEKDINLMINGMSTFGNIIIQELIDVLQIEVPEHSTLGNTKFTPFFIHDQFNGTITNAGVVVNIAPNSLKVHNGENSKFALVEPKTS